MEEVEGGWGIVWGFVGGYGFVLVRDGVVCGCVSV